MSLLGNLKSLLAGGKVDIQARFEILREAISGTMSKFYQARDRQNDSIIGLKILDAKKTSELDARFKGMDKPCEGAVALLMHHPRIVKTYEHGLTTNNEQYVVMEFLDGPGVNSLLISRSHLLDNRRLQMIRETAEALAEVHRMGYIHRDVCPRNLVIGRDGNDLKLIDFGLTVPATAPFMQPGIRTGTPNYLAPEVVRRKPTSQLIDMFAFGVTAFEICTYELPWPRGATGLDAIKRDNLVPVDIRTLRPDIHPKLANAIMSCLNSEPSKRPQSMQAFLALIKDLKHEDQVG